MAKYATKEELTLSDANYSIGVIHKPDLADFV